ncbi:MAG: tetratricopeptide repeat protein [Candidatus Eisenbacteria bacterium]
MRTFFSGSGRRMEARAPTPSVAPLALGILLMSAAILLSPIPSHARGEGKNARELFLASQSLVLGNVEEAIRIYERILTADPSEERAFWGLVEVYASAGMDREHLVPLLTEWLEDHPDDLRAKKELGAGYARLGDHDRAHELWMQHLHQGVPDASRYSEIGALELRYRMVEYAVETYLEARRTFELPDFFAQELVRAYTELGRYEKAIAECVIAVNEHSGIVQWAVNRVELMLDEGASRRDVERLTDEIARSDDASPSVLNFAGSVYVALDRPDRALETFLLADTAIGDDGRFLLDLAGLLDDAGLAGRAREAYAAVQERHPGTMHAAEAGVGIGRGLAREGKVEEALSELRGTGERYPQFSEGGEALLAAAELELTALRDPDAALATVEVLLDERRGRGKQLIEEAGLLRVTALLALGRFADAHTAAEALLSGRMRDHAQERAAYHLGFSSFLEGEHRRALEEFRAMIEADPSGALVNDALRLMLLVAEAEEGSDDGPLHTLSFAYHAHLRGEDARAAGLLEEVVDASPGSAAATEAMLLLGALASAAGDHGRALDIYAAVVVESSSLTARAEALMRSGDIMLHHLDRPDEAVRRYSAILADLPTNALSGEARRKIEAIRKNGGVEG